MAKIVNTSGKRKTAIARATLRPGNGIVRINSVPLEIYPNEMVRLKIAEPLLLLPNALKESMWPSMCSGGGIMGQAEASPHSTCHGESSSGTTIPRSRMSIPGL